MLDIFTYILCSIIVSIEIEGDWGGGVCCFYLCPVQCKLHDTNLHRAEQSNKYDNVYVLFTWKHITGKKSCLIHLNASAGRIFVLPGHSKQHNNAGIIQNATVCGWASHIFR